MTDTDTRNRTLGLLIGGGAAGLLIGLLGVGVIARNRTPAPEPAPPEAADELAQVEAPVEEAPAPVDETLTVPAEELQAAQAQVQDLQQQLADTEAELGRVRTERSARATAARKALEAKVAELESQLAQAVAERDQARADLGQALKDLDAQVALTRRVTRERDEYREANVDNLWAAFVNDTKTRICDRGTRKGLARCHDQVAEALTGVSRTRFEDCVKTWQAVPYVAQLERKTAMPAFGEPFPAGTKAEKKDWYVQYCDPTLPEATRAEGDALPEPPVWSVAAR